MKKTIRNKMIDTGDAYIYMEPEKQVMSGLQMNALWPCVTSGTWIMEKRTGENRHPNA